jgi:hypothetical protein
MTTFDDAASRALFNQVASHAASLGLFDFPVATHEPKNAPGNGLSCSIVLDTIGPVQSSGLTATSIKVVFKVRIWNSMLQEPQDGIDPNQLAAATTLMNAYTGSFTFGSTVREIDLLGEFGDSLSAVAGYIEIDKRIMRVIDITLPVIVNDAWTQGA